MSRKAINSVLYNFLETYTSRYSDYDGYWLFGMLVVRMEQMNIDLFDAKGDLYKDAVMATAARLASTKFKDQMEKAGLNLSCIREGHLTITKSPDLRKGNVNGRTSTGFELNFEARAVSIHGKIYERRKLLFAAPHDPLAELRSVRRGHQR